MNKLKLTLTQLMHELESAKQSLAKPGSVHIAKSSMKPKGKPKGGNKKKKKKAGVSNSNPTAMKKPKGKCFKCGQKSHWKKDCPEMNKKSGNIGDLNIIEAYFVENYNDKWIIDSVATNHICYSL